MGKVWAQGPPLDELAPLHAAYVAALRDAFGVVAGRDLLLDALLPLSPPRAVRRALRKTSDQLRPDACQFLHAVVWDRIVWPEREVRELVEIARELQDAVDAGAVQIEQEREEIAAVATSLESFTAAAATLVAGAQLWRDAAGAEADSLRLLELPEEEAVADHAAAGFAGGDALAAALGVPPQRRTAFFQLLSRKRTSLADGDWREVRNRRPNEPQFTYRVDSPQLQAWARPYAAPHSA